MLYKEATAEKRSISFSHYVDSDIVFQRMEIQANRQNLGIEAPCLKLKNTWHYRNEKYGSLYINIQEHSIAKPCTKAQTQLEAELGLIHSATPKSPTHQSYYPDKYKDARIRSQPEINKTKESSLN